MQWPGSIGILLSHIHPHYITERRIRLDYLGSAGIGRSSFREHPTRCEINHRRVYNGVSGADRNRREAQARRRKSKTSARRATCLAYIGQVAASIGNKHILRDRIEYRIVET